MAQHQNFFTDKESYCDWCFSDPILGVSAGLRDGNYVPSVIRIFDCAPPDGGFPPFDDKQLQSEFKELAVRCDELEHGSFPMGCAKEWSALHERFLNGVVDRVLNTGSFSVARCPQCNRILRTPNARQCRWCYHDWHSQP